MMFHVMNHVSHHGMMVIDNMAMVVVAHIFGCRRDGHE
jgi:hypothetical protein